MSVEESVIDGCHLKDDHRNTQDKALICFLEKIGFSQAETKKYLLLIEHESTYLQQINMLIKKRGTLLDKIHDYQQTLDSLDVMIWEKRKEVRK